MCQLSLSCHERNIAMLPWLCYIVTMAIQCCHGNVSMAVLPSQCYHGNITLAMLPWRCYIVTMVMLPWKCYIATMAIQCYSGNVTMAMYYLIKKNFDKISLNMFGILKFMIYLRFRACFLEFCRYGFSVLICAS